MNRTRERGFTLVELLVSLAILSVALGVLLGAISDSLDRVRKGKDEAVAGALVQSLLSRAQVQDPIAPAQISGVYSNGFRWSLGIQPYGSADDAKAWHATAYILRARVAWKDGARSLSAIRLVPPASAP